jgi:hypothetical protein
MVVKQKKPSKKVKDLAVKSGQTRKVKGGFLSLGVRAGMPTPPPIAPQDSVFMPQPPPIRNK